MIKNNNESAESKGCLLNQIDSHSSLMKKWECAFTKEFRNSCEERGIDKCFIFDGAYKFYDEQTIKILFIGEYCSELQCVKGKDESLNYNCTICKAIKDGKIGTANLKNYPFHFRMLKVAYGILNNFLSFENIKNVSPLKLRKEFAVKGGYSYAFINLSKLLNVRLKSEYGKIFLEKSQKQGFYAREIELLNPDIIIGMNQHIRISQLFKDNFNLIKKIGNDDVHLYELKIGGRTYNYLDAHNFGYRFKDKKEEVFYTPIIDACKEIFEENGETQTNK